MKREKNGIYILISQFFSYFCVGGVAALVEWASFYLICDVCGFWYVAATVASFLLATLVNYILGRLWTFKDQSQKGKHFREAMAVYLVSLMGLIFNLILMALFVDILHLQTMLSKILATGLVFIWNFLSRKIFIYKDSKVER